MAYSALIPPPRYPLVRYHGVLAPGSKWRRDVVPKPREPNFACPRAAESPAKPAPPRSAQSVPRERQPLREPARADAAVTADRIVRDGLCSLPELAAGMTLLTPNILSVRHWDRLLGGRLLAPAARVDWATLLQRTFHVDVLACPKCGGRLRVLGEITEPLLVRVVLESLGIPTAAPRPARARDPTALLAELDTN
jgi:hypothetical protein